MIKMDACNPVDFHIPELLCFSNARSCVPLTLPLDHKCIYDVTLFIMYHTIYLRIMNIHTSDI